MAIPYTFAGQTGTIPLSELDSNFTYVGDSSGVVYVPAGTNAVATTVQAKLRQTVSVDDFGAVGNGSTNDYTAISNAQTALVAAGGGTLLFTQGKTYLVGTAIPMQTGITYKGGGRSNIDATTIPGAKIVSTTSSIFTNTVGTIAGVTFDGLWLQSSVGGGHIFDWNAVGIVAKIEVKNCVLKQLNAAKSVISGVGTSSSHGVFSIWFHHSEYSYVPSSTVSAINIRAFTVNSIIMDTFWSTCTAQALTGFPSITIESTNASGSAFDVLVKQGTFEFANAGAVKLLSCYYSGIEQCVSYDIDSTTYPLSNPTFQISKGVGPASAMCWVKGCRSKFGTATYPDMRIDMLVGGSGLFTVSESDFSWFDGVGSANAGVSFRGNSITNFENVSFLSLNEGTEKDLFFSTTDATAKSYAIWNGNASSSAGYLNFTQGANSGTSVPAMSYLGGFSPAGLFQWGGSAVAPNLYITQGGLLYPNTLILRQKVIDASSSPTFASYAGSIPIDNTYQSFILTPPNSSAFTVTSPLYLYTGQSFTVTIKNSTGGALGTLTWGGLYQLLSSWVQPATGTTASITFLCDGTNFVETSRTTVSGTVNLTGPVTSVGAATTIVGPIPAVTLSGTMSGGGNQINNVVIGTTTPLAGAFTSLSASTTLGVTGVSSLLGGAVVNSATTNFTQKFQSISTTGQSNAAFFKYVANATGPDITIAKSRGATATAYDAVQLGDTLGAINFAGTDGSALVTPGSISAVVDGFVGAGSVNMALYFATGSSGGGGTKLAIASGGGVTMAAYGAGTATFSASGFISSVSDETYKIKDGVVADPMSMIMALEPGYYFGKPEANMGPGRQLGFYAQNVRAAIGPEAAPDPEPSKPWGYFDRSVLAVAIEAIKVQKAQIDALTARIAALEAKS